MALGLMDCNQSLWEFTPVMPVEVRDCNHSVSSVHAMSIEIMDCNHSGNCVHSMSIGIMDCNHSGSSFHVISVPCGHLSGLD